MKLTDEQIEACVFRSGLDEDLWFGRFTPKGYEDAMPKLRRFAEAVLASIPPNTPVDALRRAGAAGPLGDEEVASGVPAGVRGLTDEAIDRLARKHGATLEDDNGMVPAFYSMPMNNLATFVRAAIASGVAGTLKGSE